MPDDNPSTHSTCVHKIPFNTCKWCCPELGKVEPPPLELVVLGVKLEPDLKERPYRGTHFEMYSAQVGIFEVYIRVLSGFESVAVGYQAQWHLSLPGQSPSKSHRADTPEDAAQAVSRELKQLIQSMVAMLAMVEEPVEEPIACAELGHYEALDQQGKVVATGATREQTRLLAGEQGYPRAVIRYIPPKTS